LHHTDFEKYVNIVEFKKPDLESKCDRQSSLSFTTFKLLFGKSHENISVPGQSFMKHTQQLHLSLTPHFWSEKHRDWETERWDSEEETAQQSSWGHCTTGMSLYIDAWSC
jgi:hypothetical protein